MIKIIGSLLKQYAYQTPESSGAVFTQYDAEEERGRLPVEAHTAVLEDKPFYQTTDDEARPDVIYAKIRGEGISRRVQRPPQEPHSYEHQEKGE